MRLTKKGRAQSEPKFSPFSRYVAARDRRIIALGRQGHTAREIALGMGVSLAPVYRVGAKNGGLSFRSARERKHNNQIVILFRQNLAAQEIADAVGCSLATVYRVIAKSGCPAQGKVPAAQESRTE